MKKKYILLLLCNTLIAHDINIDNNNPEQVKKGNIALRPSQQPSPLFSFGQLIVNKHTLQSQNYIQHTKINNEKFNQLILSLLYGVTDTFSVFLNIPVITNLTINKKKSTGIGNIYLQCEYLLFNKNHIESSDQITIVGSIIFPSSSTKKNPPTGINGPGFFAGPTYSHMGTDWYYYTSGGFLVSTHYQTNKKLGNQVLYQAGLGRNVGNPAHGIFTWFFELNGTYEWPDVIHDHPKKNTGSNIIFFGPTVWFSTPKTYIQGGIAFPILQHLRGKQNKAEYLCALDIGILFH